VSSYIAVFRYLKKTGMTETAFGRRAVGDGNLVRRMRRFDLKQATWDKIQKFMDENPDG
jgi:hypothetical protein